MMAPHPIPAASPDPRALTSCLDAPATRRLAGDDREALRVALRHAARADAPGENLVVAGGRAVGRVLAHGSVALYRPDPGAALVHRVLEVDPQGRVTAVLNRDPTGRLRELWVMLADGTAAGVLPGGGHHPLWGASDRLVSAAGAGAPRALTLAAAVPWQAINVIPAVAEPARLPPGAGGALLNMLAALAWDQGRSALRYRGPYPTEQLFWSLTESFRFDPSGPAADPRARFLADAEGTFARGAPVEAPVDWTPAPHERRVHSDGPADDPADRLVVQLRDGVERVAWRGRSYHRTNCQGLRRREHRVIRSIETGGGTLRYVAAIEALGRVVEDHLVLGAAGELLERPPLSLDPGPEGPLAGLWHDALGTLLPLEATPLLAGAISAVWPEIQLAWGPIPGDLVEARGTTLRLSPKLARVYRSAGEGAATAGGRRALAQQLVREVLGLIGPTVRDAAVSWLLALDPARQDAALAAAARRDRVTLARAAVEPLGRLLDALEAGAALPE